MKKSISLVSGGLKPKIRVPCQVINSWEGLSSSRVIDGHILAAFESQRGEEERCRNWWLWGERGREREQENLVSFHKDPSLWTSHSYLSKALYTKYKILRF